MPSASAIRNVVRLLSLMRTSARSTSLRACSAARGSTSAARVLLSDDRALSKRPNAWPRRRRSWAAIPMSHGRHDGRPSYRAALAAAARKVACTRSSTSAASDVARATKPRIGSWYRS